MSSTKIKTVKRLFAVSGNRCTFPKCTHKLIDSNTGKVLGEICHIKAQNPDGPRYDKNLKVTEVNDFSNLILLCPLHHTIVDSDIESYTVERLYNMKSIHESTFENQKLKIDDNTANQFIINKTITNTIVFETNKLKQINPQGGQYANTIQNFNSPLTFSDNISFDDLLTRIYDNSIPLSQILAEAIKIAKKRNDHPILELCKNELMGWSKKNLPEYRKVEVYISLEQIKSVNDLRMEEFWAEIDSNQDFVKKEMLFPIAVPLLEKSVEEGKHLDPAKSYIHLTQRQGDMFPKMPYPEITIHIYARGSLYNGLLKSVRNHLAKEILKKIN